ncbi:MAG: hypothetical protein EBX41_03230 [Chitinophagia bacterium]|nr:hypothetical protein [Chitinophagia bacterium]
MKRILKIVKRIIFVLLLVVVLIAGLLSYPPVQTYLAQQASNELSKVLKTKVSVAQVQIDLLNHVLIKGVFAGDQQNDTLLYAGELQVRLSDIVFSKNKPVIHYAGLKNATVKLLREGQKGEWNYDFIEKLFPASGKTKDTTSSSFEFDLQKVYLENIRFVYADKWVGQDIIAQVGKDEINVKNIDLFKKSISIEAIYLQEIALDVKMYIGGRPPENDSVDDNESDADSVIEALNPDKWTIAVNSLQLADCRFGYDILHKKHDTSIFDPNHMRITNINMLSKRVAISGDTITGKLDDFSAKEQCGLVVSKIASSVRVTPLSAVCSDLVLKTQYSSLSHRFAMYYRGFPAFLDFIPKVTMEAALSKSIIDSRDIAFFAKELRLLPCKLQVSGYAKGTLEHIKGRGIDITDGINRLTTDVVINGLPDINYTYFTLTNALISSNGKGVVRYFPEIKRDTTINMDTLRTLTYAGTFNGKIDSFAVSGLVHSNIGDIKAEVLLEMPGFNLSKATYKGNVSLQQIAAKSLFKTSAISSITCTESITGKSFFFDSASVDINGEIDSMHFNHYTYHRIINKGIISHRQFDGSLWIDDPNLAMEFEGSVNYKTQDLLINAEAHLLHSDLKALYLTQDTITLSSDFELNCKGRTVDQFIGNAKLYNIDLKRNGTLVDIDSISLTSGYLANNEKKVTVISNDVAMNITGNYQITKLPASIQYFLHQYIPGYIPLPNRNPSTQSFKFDIKTRHVDSLLAVTYPTIRGLNDAVMSGEINTSEQKLLLNLKVGLLQIGAIKIWDVDINSNGDTTRLILETHIDKMSVANNTLINQFVLKSKLKNDTLDFNIKTKLTDSISQIMLTGQMLARNDTLNLALQPSLLDISKNHWYIPTCNDIQLSHNYVSIPMFKMTSGVQIISASTQQYNNQPQLHIDLQQVDMAQLSALTKTNFLKPEGRINGVVNIDNFIEDPQIGVNISAQHVMILDDTLGKVNVIAQYNPTKEALVIDPETGIFNGDAVVKAGGTLFTNIKSTGNNDLKVLIKNMNLAIIQPFVTDIVSRLTGKVNGGFQYTGSGSKKEIEGQIDLSNCGFVLDYLGVPYTLPKAQIKIDKRQIVCRNVQVFDDQQNTATINFYASHNWLDNMKLHLNVSTPKLVLLRTNETQNSYFFGNVVASLDSFTLTGSLDYLKMHAYNLSPVDRSQLYIPISSSANVSAYKYVTFKSHSTAPVKTTHIDNNKMDIKIDANLNELAKMTIVLDPATGDAINTTGEGNIQLSIPAGNDMRMTGIYTIKSGTYDLTLKQILYKRQFLLNEGSTINFIGPFFETELNVNAIYPTRVRLSELLTESEKGSDFQSVDELNDAKTLQTMNVLLKMKGTLKTPLLSFDMELPENRSVSTYAYRKLMRINQDDQQKFDLWLIITIRLTIQAEIAT